MRFKKLVKQSVINKYLNNLSALAAILGCKDKNPSYQFVYVLENQFGFTYSQAYQMFINPNASIGIHLWWRANKDGTESISQCNISVFADPANLYNSLRAYYDCQVVDAYRFLLISAVQGEQKQC